MQASKRETVKVAQKLTAAERESFAEFEANEKATSMPPVTAPNNDDVFKAWSDNRLPWLGASQKYRLVRVE